MADEPKAPSDKPASNVTHIADAAFKKKRPKKNREPVDPNDDRPLIRLAAGKRPKILDEADEALGKRDGQVFDHVGRMVRLTQPGELKPTTEDVIRRQANAILLHEVTPPNLCDRLARVARWEKYDARAGDWITSDVPPAIADGLIARAGEWRHIPRLRGFVEAPTLRDDGSLLDHPGYDAASELFFVGALPSGYSKPIESRDHAKDALGRLEDALYGLPFVAREDKSALIASILAALVRRVLPSAPLVGITAPTPGTGKSMVADAISIIATGRRAAVLGLGKDEIEADKRLAGALLAGDAVVCIDNVERPLFGDLICQALTQPSIRIRALGRSDLIPTPTNTLLIVTANNIDIRGDLRRRVTLVRLDAKTERPELRRFDRDFLTDIAANRGELIQAALTIIRAYLASGEAGNAVTPFGSFEHWSKWCREPLVWLGLPDPLLASESLREQDPDLVAQRQLFAAWFRLFESREVTAAEVINRAEGITADDELRTALDTVCAERIAPRRLTYWLRRHKERMLDGLRLEVGGTDVHSKVGKWRLVKC